MSDESEHSQKSRLLVATLVTSGILDGFSHQEVISALLFMMARAVKREEKLSALLCLQVIERTVTTMKKHERTTGWLENLLTIPDPVRPS